MEHDVIVPTPLLTYLHSSRRAFRFRRVLVALVISGLVEIKLEGEDGLQSPLVVVLLLSDVHRPLFFA